MAVFAILPQTIQQQLFLERDPHGNVQVSLIESEKLFSALVKDKLNERGFTGKFNALHTSSDTKDVVHSHQTSMLTIATH